MLRAVFAAVLVLAAFVSAQELPYVPGQTPAASTHNFRLDRTAVQRAQAQSPGGKVWTRLARMTPAQRANARINIELDANATSEALAFARTVEANWNDGRYDDALAGFESLARLTDPAEIAIGCSWRKPVPTIQTALWGTDVRIGNRDSVQLVRLDVDRATGHLFAVLKYPSGSSNYWSINLSTDGGATWSETYEWSTSLSMYSVSTTVMTDYCYVAYDGGASPNREARIRRFSASTGAQAPFTGGAYYITVYTAAANDSIKEVSVVSNQDYFNNRLYCLAITYSGTLAFVWSDTGAVAWTEIATGVTNADRGLSDCTNEGYDSLFLWASYYDKSNNLRIDTDRPGDVWGNVLSSPAGTSTPLTSIGAYHDTLLCAFDYQGSSVYWCKYFVSYNGGTNWSWLYLDPDTMTTSESPAVMLRGGGGEGAVYRYYTPTRSLRYTWRPYTGGSWSTPVSIAANQPYWNQPGIQYLGSGNFGVAYLSWSTPSIRGAYFVRSDSTGVAEQRRLVMEENILSVTPNPLSGSGRLNYTLNRPADLRVQVYDRAGRVVRTLFDGHSPAGRQSLGFDAAGMTPGVYFVRANADGATLTVPMTIVK